MRVVNLFGGPGSGKSTMAAALFVHFKNRAIRCELVGEEAKDQIYWGSRNQLANQFLLAANQYARLKNLETAGCEIAVADSPLIMSPSYAMKHPYYHHLAALVQKVNEEFDNTYVFVKRTKPYSNFGRMQETVEEAKKIDVLLMDQFKADLTVTGDAEGQAALGEILDHRFGFIAKQEAV